MEDIREADKDKVECLIEQKDEWMFECDVCKEEYNINKIVKLGCCSFKGCKECVKKCNNKCPQCREKIDLYDRDTYSSNQPPLDVELVGQEQNQNNTRNNLRDLETEMNMDEYMRLRRSSILSSGNRFRLAHQTSIAGRNSNSVVDGSLIQRYLPHIARRDTRL